ncbi:MAG: hypothetical protein P8Y97_17845, partial [Candidatus Lokiarchaeota archaeon]
MISLKIWFKKLRYNKKKSVILFIILILPLILFSGIILNFLNGYFASFEEYTYQNVGSDLSFTTINNDVQGIYRELDKCLNNYPHIGYVSQLPYIPETNMNLTVYNISSFYFSTYINQSIDIRGFNFSNSRIRSFYITRYIPISSGRLPKKGNEIIVPESFKSTYNISLNSVLNFHYLNKIDENVTIVGFYNGNPDVRWAPKTSFIFLINTYNYQFIQKFKINAYSIYYDIYLNHKYMDVFNINSFIQELSQIKTILHSDLSSYLSHYVDISSKSSDYTDNEFTQYMNGVYIDPFSILTPILLITFMFLTISINYISTIDGPIWEKMRYYSSKKGIMMQIFLETMLNNIIASLIVIPSGIGLYILANLFTGFSVSEFGIYIPLSYYILTSSFSIFCALLIFFALNVNFRKRNLEKVDSNVSSSSFLRKHWKIALILIILISPPILNTILYFTIFNSYNMFSAYFGWFVWLISLIYSTILVLGIIVLCSNWIIKLIQYIVKKHPFSKIKNVRFRLLRKFIHYKHKSILVVIIILGLQLAFINFYQIKNYNQYQFDRSKIYLNYGSDYKLYDYGYHHNSSIDPLNYMDEKDYCQINSISGAIFDGPLLLSGDLFTLFQFNFDKYREVLTTQSQSALDSNMKSMINSLGSHETLVPIYLKYRYNLQIGDTFEIRPINTSSVVPGNYNYDYVKNYTLSMKIMGFITNIPGIDQDGYLFSVPPFSHNKLAIIVSPKFNFSSEFPKLPIQYTYLVKNFNNSLNVLKSIAYEHPGIFYVALQDGLKTFNNSYQTISSNFTLLMYIIFIISFVFITLLFIYNFINENSKNWNLFQLFGFREKDIKKFIFISL